LEDLNKNLLAGRDREPNLSRSANRPAMYSAIRTGAVENVVFVGGSNANQLSFAAAALGVDTYKHAQGGWKVTKDSIDKLIPDLKNTLSAVPPDTPVVFFCLDNSSFMGLKDDGSMAVISRCVEGDDGFHVVGELVVAPERALSHVHVQLKRAVEACGDHPVFIVTPWPRFARTPCCSDVGHVTNFNNADFLSTILGDLNKHKTALRKALPSATIIDGLELISGAGYNAEKAAAVINSGWAFDPVHPSKHVYAKMALNLLEKVAPQNMDGGQSGQRHTDNRKRSWSSSNQGGGGGHSGQSRDGQNSSSSVSSGGRQTARSQQWKEGGRRDSVRSSHSGGYASGSDGGGHYDRRYSDGRAAGSGGRGGFNPGYRGKFDSGYGRGGRGGGRGGGYGGRF
jgi:hypothetical protein